MTRTQQTFNPADYGFRWVGDWYEFDRVGATAAAVKARNDRARELRREGYRVKYFRLPDQLISRGGIGSGHPHIELHVTVYGLDVF